MSLSSMDRRGEGHGKGEESRLNEMRRLMVKDKLNYWFVFFYVRYMVM